MEKKDSRIYVVQQKDSAGSVVKTRLVRAGTPSAAERHVSKPMFSASVATQDELVALAASGVKVEEVKA
jgi:hypothetical protein